MPILEMSRRVSRLVPLAALALAASGCAMLDASMHRVANIITPYRADVLQGNVVTREQVGALKPGLSPEQVRQLLGSPLLIDSFHQNRWDYIFVVRRRGVETQRRSLVVWFENDVVSKIDAPEMPSEYEFVNAISTRPVAEGQVKLALSPEERAALPPPEIGRAHV